jgi:hypothetical protein
MTLIERLQQADGPRRELFEEAALILVGTEDEDR